MSKAYYYCKNFSFKEVNNIFAYAVKNPETLTQQQRITRLYKGVLRRLISNNIHTIKRVNFEKFHDEQYAVRRDFDKIYNNPNATEEDIQQMIDKYEFFVEENFEPYAAMHESRQHSNLWGKMVLWGDAALNTDHVGFYSKNVLINGAPTSGHYHEEYPHQAGAWLYDEKYINEDFNYDDVEQQYADAEAASTSTAADVKAQLDDAHK